MRIISEKHIRDFWSAANGAERTARENAMREWMAVVRGAEWTNFADIRKTFNHAGVYGGCVIFDVGGNKYRVIVKAAFRIKVVFIRAVLTHVEYDKKKWQGDCK